MSKSERYNWIIIYLNIPLWIAVFALIAFGRWSIAVWLVSFNIGLLFLALFLSGLHLMKSRKEETKDGTS
jgi:hypothetical protein